MGERSRFLPELHAFRGVAILCIVATHVGQLNQALVRDERGSHFMAALHETIWHDSTIFFALISGILYARVLAARGTERFYRNKALNVALPYACMTLLFSSIRFNEREGFELQMPAVDTLTSHLVHGTAMYPYWYIPVLLILFGLTPMIDRALTKVPVSVFAFAALPWLFPRTGTHASISTLGYFLGVYAVGLHVGYRYDEYRALGRRYWPWALAAAALTSALLLASLYLRVDFRGSFRLQEGLWYVQKLAAASLLLTMLSHYLRAVPRLLDVLAHQAFAVYFVHAFINAVVVTWVISHTSGPMTLIAQCAWGTAVFAVVLLASVAVVSITKRLTGRWSRRLIGA